MATRRFQITLKTEGPVHIGCGQVLGKKDYFIKRENGQMKTVVLDAAKFVSQLDSDELDAYCDFLERDSRSSLEEFLTVHNLHRKAEAAQRYQLDTVLSQRRSRGWQYFDAQEFVKDAYGCPYVPGSSFKGMFRTILLSALIEDNPQPFLLRYPKDEDRTGRPGARPREWRRGTNPDRDIDRHAFFKETPDPNDRRVINDIMRYVAVSDSEPLSTDDLVFAKKYDRFSKADPADHKRQMGHQSIGEIEDGNELNIYWECLRPGTIVNLRMSIDDRIDSYLPFPLDEEHICNLFSRFDKRYRECFLDKFDLDLGSGNRDNNRDDGQCRYIIQSGPFKGRRCPNRAIGNTGYCNSHKDQAAAALETGSAESGLVCYLGGGVDFDSKTVLNALFKDDDDRRLYEISHILYAQFPTRIDDSFNRGMHRPLWNAIKAHGFSPRKMTARFGRNGRVIRAKDDHRHWRDQEFGVSPHTLKLGKVGNELLPMGKCTLTIESEKLPERRAKGN